jgi:RND family efflux transporter MFP subunit
MARASRWGALLLLLAGLGWIGWAVAGRLSSPGEGGRTSSGQAPAPVEVAPIERGPIELRRAFSGTLEPRERVVVAPKVGGRVERIEVNLGDPVKRGQVVARLDDDEFVQAIAQAEADLAVAKARVAEGKSALEFAGRRLDRMKTLRGEGVASESELDVATSERLAAKATLEVAEAQRDRAEAALETARIRLSYTRVAATWSGAEEERVVSERFLDEGGTVSANTPLLAIVSLDPIQAVVFATEGDYARLRIGQAASLHTDAHPGRRFAGRIARIAPVFRQASRQARVELVAENPGYALKPGMFVRAEVVLDRAEDAALVPLSALTTRGGATGVFLVDAAGERVSWRPVTLGIQDAGRAQVLGEGLGGRVVVLGQQLLDDGSRIAIPAAAPGTGGGKGGRAPGDGGGS